MAVNTLAELGSGVFVVKLEGKIIGVADYAESLDHIPGTVAYVNTVVADRYQGSGIGRSLMASRAEHLRRKGYRHCLGNVFADNQRNIRRLRRNGWRETTYSRETGGYMRTFWIALNDDVKDIEPVELNIDEFPE